MIHRLLGQKRGQIILIAVGTGVVVSLLWLFLIAPLRDRLNVKVQNGAEVMNRLANAQRAVKLAASTKEELLAAAQNLRAVEQSVAQGDIYRWAVNLLLSFEGPSEVQFANIGQPAVGELTAPPKVPYRSAIFTVSGIATYHQFGRFLAEFERRYPLVRFQYLDLEPTSDVETDPNAPGKLSFKLDFLILVKPPTAAK